MISCATSGTSRVNLVTNPVNGERTGKYLRQVKHIRDHLSTRREPPTLGKQLVNFITCGCESSASFFAIYKAGRENPVNGERTGKYLRQVKHIRDHL
jgi:CHAD domain-containing protein